MKLKRVLSVHSLYENPTGAQLTAHMTGNQRVSLLEEMRRDAAKIFHYEYPQRLRRILQVVEQKKG
jgi:hypothetical protein